MGKYTNESIKSLKGAERVRLRPGVIFGSDDLEGCIHGFFEILSNSTDEARAGYGKQINVIKHVDNSLTVEDFGRGIPLDYNKKEKRYNYELVYDELYSGGKFGDDTYKYSLGLNGLGACATQYASKWFVATSIRDGYEYTIHFKEGKVDGKLSKKKTKSKQTGTKQTWLPDDKVFTEVNIPSERIVEILKKQAIVNSGIKYTFLDEKNNEQQEFLYPEGILGYAQEIIGDKAVAEPFLFKDEGKGKDRADKNEYKVILNVAIGFSNVSQVQEFYHNSSPLEYGGAPKKAMEKALLSFFSDACLKKKLLNKKSEITVQDVKDCLIFVSSTFSNETSYENQTKKSITNKFIEDFMTASLMKNLKKWSEENEEGFNKVCSQISVNVVSRLSAETQRLASKKKLTSKLGINDRVKNFSDCRSKDTDKRELFIVEGLSALGSTKLARDADYQAVLAIRGKVLNCLKVEASTILKSDVIMDIIKVLGCGIELNLKNKKAQTFDINKLRFNKVIIFTDQDVDGMHIQTLLLTAFYRLCPSLIKYGKIYIGETPLYEISYGNITEYAYSDKEKDSILKKHKNAKVSRNKGLGEVDPETLNKTSMDPSRRKLTEVSLDDAKKVAESFELFMGSDVGPRKAFIEENGYRYSNDLDLD